MKRSLLLSFLLLYLVMPVFAFDRDTILSDFFWNKFVKLEPVKRPKVALVLGGGGARGLAHIGVLKVLKEEKVPVDIVVGTSIGAIVGALYASEVPMDKIEALGENAGWNKLTNLSNTTILKLFLIEKLISTKKMEVFLNENIGGKKIEDLNIKFACVAADLFTGEKIVFREGDLSLAARASSTIPGLFVPVEFRHRYLVDGGLIDNIPTDVARLMGADIVIAVAVTSDFSKNSISNVYSQLTQALYIQGSVLDRERLKNADLVISPKVSEISTIDLAKSKECIESGVLAARGAMPQRIQSCSNEY
jgi:NTE family protein